MKAPVNIHPPKNWQDFETLCLKLWGEIWNIPHEIEFNSDNSQDNMELIFTNLLTED